MRPARVEARVLRQAEKPSPAPAPVVDDEVEMRRRIKELALKQQMEAMAQSSEEELEVQDDEAIERAHRKPLVEQRYEDVVKEKGEEETDSESEAIFMAKPVYVPPVKQNSKDNEERLQAEHREQAHQMLANYIKRVSNNTLNANDFDEERGTGPFDPLSVDDTDGLNPIEEEEGWRLRELLRFKRDRDFRERWEREKLELERIRNLTPEERTQLDQEKWAEWEAAQEGKSNYRFLQKYYHKGAFFQDKNDPLFNRDYNQATGTDGMDREQLPSVMQVKNFGKKGRTKWTHLTAEDTTNFEFGWGHRKNSAQFRNVTRMGGMRGDLDAPASKRPKH